jgi:calcium-dependent protein kinase
MTNPKPKLVDSKEIKVDTTNVDVKYIIDYSREIGRGHSTIVRKCRERKTGHRYAIKSICKSNKKRLLREIENEAIILAGIDHQNIIEIHDVLEDDKHFHVVTELCTGGELYDRVATTSTKSKAKHHSEREAVCILQQIVKVIAHCHEKQIVHRDLKLENILLKTKHKDDLDIKIIDFGLSTKHDAENDEPLTARVGTIYYVAPEVLKRCYTKTCDIWSIGVITYGLLSGDFPFSGTSDIETLKMIVSDLRQVEFPSTKWDGTSENAKDFIRACLQKDLSLRPSAAELSQHAWLKEEKICIHPKPFSLIVQRLKKAPYSLFQRTRNNLERKA